MVHFKELSNFWNYHYFNVWIIISCTFPTTHNLQPIAVTIHRVFKSETENKSLSDMQCCYFFTHVAITCTIEMVWSWVTNGFIRELSAKLGSKFNMVIDYFIDKITVANIIWCEGWKETTVLMTQELLKNFWSNDNFQIWSKWLVNCYVWKLYFLVRQCLITASLFQKNGPRVALCMNTFGRNMLWTERSFSLTLFNIYVICIPIFSITESKWYTSARLLSVINIHNNTMKFHCQAFSLVGYIQHSGE
jgi:hypothetical protein